MQNKTTRNAAPVRQFLLNSAYALNTNCKDKRLAPLVQDFMEDGRFDFETPQVYASLHARQGVELQTGGAVCTTGLDAVMSLDMTLGGRRRRLVWQAGVYVGSETPGADPQPVPVIRAPRETKVWDIGTQPLERAEKLQRVRHSRDTPGRVKLHVQEGHAEGDVMNGFITCALLDGEVDDPRVLVDVYLGDNCDVERATHVARIPDESLDLVSLVGSNESGPVSLPLSELTADLGLNVNDAHQAEPLEFEVPMGSEFLEFRRGAVYYQIEQGPDGPVRAEVHPMEWDDSMGMREFQRILDHLETRKNVRQEIELPAYCVPTKAYNGPSRKAQVGSQSLSLARVKDIPSFDEMDRSAWSKPSKVKTNAEALIVLADPKLSLRKEEDRDWLVLPGCSIRGYGEVTFGDFTALLPREVDKLLRQQRRLGAPGAKTSLKSALRKAGVKASFETVTFEQ